jgi:formylglycine-generating enzyme required for sulfatase activity
MAYIDRLDEWQFIYLQSNTGTSSASVYGATITDSRTWNDHVDDAGAVGCFLPTDSSFQIAAEGSNQQTNIAGFADPVTTGGHSDTASRRMISNYFLEDCCGAMWQWLQDQSFQPGSGVAGWKDVFPDADKGQLYLMADNADVKLLAGGDWGSAASCGSRSRYAGNSRWGATAGVGARFAARAIHK